MSYGDWLLSVKGAVATQLMLEDTNRKDALTNHSRRRSAFYEALDGREELRRVIVDLYDDGESSKYLARLLGLTLEVKP